MRKFFLLACTLFIVMAQVVFVLPALVAAQANVEAGQSVRLFLPLINNGEAATVQAASNQTLFGVHEFNIAAQGNVPDRVARLQQLGAQVVRLPVTWHLLEAGGKGQTAAWFWASLDADVAAAERAGVKLIIELALTPCWASSDPAKRCSDPTYDGYLHYPPTNLNDYGDALARLVQRYHSRVYAWEVWNEPNLVGNWLPLGARPYAENDNYNSFIDLSGARQYATMVKAAYTKVKAVDPSAIVLAGSLAGGDVAYLNELYAAGVKGYFDGLSMHPYTDVYPVNVGAPLYGKSYGPDECPTGVREPKLWCFQLGVERIHQAMLNQSDTRGIWFTEFGFSSTTVWNGSGLNGQADQLRKAVALIRQWGFVPVACWYNMVDRPGADGRETRFGLFDANLLIKPAGTAFKTLLATVKPVLLAPQGIITTTKPTYRWQPVTGATQYFLWVNDYGLTTEPDIPGKVQLTLTPQQAHCTATECSFQPTTTIRRGGAEWWITAIFPTGERIEGTGLYFTVN